MFNRLIRISKLTLVAVFLVSCKEQHECSKPPDMSNSITLPTVSISLALTGDDSSAFLATGETIAGTVYFDGDGQKLNECKTAPFRDVYLGKHEFEFKKPGTKKFEGIKISKEAYGRLSDRNFHYIFNFYSGRRVFENNVLDCGTAPGRHTNLEQLTAPIKITCSVSSRFREANP